MFRVMWYFIVGTLAVVVFISKPTDGKKKKTTVAPPKWSDWGPWDTACSVTCGIGVRRRHRTCIQPTEEPKNEKEKYKLVSASIYKRCKGSESSQSKNCDTGVTCPIHGGWSKWKSWECTVTCGGGRGKRYRTCDNPKPMFSGENCEGPSEEFGKCNEQLCPDQIYTLSPKTKNSLQQAITDVHLNYRKKEGESVRIPCKSEVVGEIYGDYPKSKLYWTKNGKVMELNEARMEMTSSELVLSDVTAEDNGVYVCRINYAPDVDKPISVAAVTVLSSKPTVSVHTGSRFELPCNGAHLARIYKNLTQKWLHNNVLYKDFKPETPPKRNGLVMQSATRNMSGVWSCELEDPRTKRTWVTNVVRLAILPEAPFHKTILSNRNVLVLVSILGFLLVIVFGTYFSYVITSTKEECEKEFEKWVMVSEMEMDDIQEKDQEDEIVPLLEDDTSADEG